MALPIALQLYTVRDELKRDFTGTLKSVAEMGYKYVEFAGFFNHDAQAVRAICDRLGLTPVSAHVGVSGENTGELIEIAKTLGIQYLVSGLPDGAMRESADGYRRAVTIFNQVAAELATHGLTYCYHNHSFEYDKLDGGKRGMDILYDESDPPLNAELDVYWVQHGHDDPLKWMNKLAGRTPLLHIKDMADDADRSFIEVGTGILEMKKIVDAAEGVGARYLIIEQDRGWINDSPLESAKVSLDNLTKLVGG